MKWWLLSVQFKSIKCKCRIPWVGGVGVFGFYQSNISQTFTQQQELMVSGVYFIAPQMCKNRGNWINRSWGFWLLFIEQSCKWKNILRRKNWGKRKKNKVPCTLTRSSSQVWPLNLYGYLKITSLKGKTQLQNWNSSVQHGRAMWGNNCNWGKEKRRKGG